MEILNLVFVSCIISFSSTQAKIGYFWHITDFHYDPIYTSQGDIRRNFRRPDEKGSTWYYRSLGRYGDYTCHSSLLLIESAAKYMRTRHSDNLEFVLWTGDIVTAQYTRNEETRYQAIRNITELLSQTFSSHFVFPVLGHLDPAPSVSLANLWMHWLPIEALQTFQSGGYYTIEQSYSKLRIVALNTNLFSVHEANSEQSKKQWEWLNNVLDKATAKNEMVYIVGHAEPGSDSRLTYTSPDANAQYLETVRRYAHNIAGQFFGHIHADTFRIIYENDRPVSWALMAPSVSPHRDTGSFSNPGIRLYKFDTNTGKLLDYTQYYLDLDAANRNSVAEWMVEYNFTQYYGLPEISALSMHNLAEKMRIGTHHEATTFDKYLRAYNVRHDTSDKCDGACVHRHFCSITSLEHVAYEQCVQAAASALATAADSNALSPTAVIQILLLCNFVYC